MIIFHPRPAWRAFLLPWLLVLLGVAACAVPVRGAALFEALGREPGIERIVDGLLLNILDDRRIAHHFADSNILHLREKLIEQICAESGGPCVYTGANMQESHAGRGFTDADFNALVESLQAAMRAEGVAFEAQNRLLARLAPMRRDIVYQ